MPGRKNHRPVLHVQTNPSNTQSFGSATTYYESDSSEEETVQAKMAYDYSARPINVTTSAYPLTAAAYCPRRPTLQEILQNRAPAPWSLAQFMAYLSHNHCLETLEFTMDAERYKKHYHKMASRHPHSPVSPTSNEAKHVRMLWQRLVDAYIAPNGPREVNLPSNVRDYLLSLGAADPYMPPHPSVLESAVAKINELMEESVLVPFLNTQCPAMAQHQTYCENNSDESVASYDGQATYQQASRSQPQIPVTPYGTYAVPANATYRASAPPAASYSRSLGTSTHHSRFASGPARYTSVHSASPETLTDDSGSATPGSTHDPMTPPTTPPMSDYGGGGSWAAEIYTSNAQNGGQSQTSSAGNSPRSSRAEPAGIAHATANQWKRVSSKLGWRKRSDDHLHDAMEE